MHSCSWCNTFQLCRLKIPLYVPAHPLCVHLELSSGLGKSPPPHDLVLSLSATQFTTPPPSLTGLVLLSPLFSRFQCLDLSFGLKQQRWQKKMRN
jgi:hypothetical protein